MLPRYLQFLDRIPRTETEKIQRNLLQQDTQNVLDISGSA
jgi:acyl-coenzyme A synthetase/AMP-(fatty) acid ligase